MPLEPIVPFSYRKGSIVTIECWNFVTYTHAAIHPNSRLNLIVGPNGSGKSSIVCAMCLGMGGKPSLLGRGNYAKDYVKHGENLATIEISMATGTGKEVLVLKREIITNYERTDDKTEWYFGSGRDAKKCKLKEIQAVVAAYNIQLSNYTQFLPQDVVKEFPALTAEQLLRKTEEALGTHQSQPSKFTAPAHRGAWYCALLTSSSLCTLRRYFAVRQAREADRAARNGQRRPHAV